jgi:hypothetical protein
MGWWDFGILGGDTPLDYLHSIEDIVGIERGEELEGALYPLDARPELKEAIEAHLDKLISGLYSVKWEGKTYDQDHSRDPVWYQVVGAVIMATGASITDEQREIIVEKSLEDEWMMEEGRDSSRGLAILNFVDALNAYDGEIRVIAQKGLFEKMAEMMSAGESGLANENIPEGDL